jgi:N-[(2S)-2-amino-2-carboxyethyl]-L-glutamate dehydrogenase
MPDSELTVISGSAVRDILDGREDLVLSAVRDAYRAHGIGTTRCPGTQPLYANGGRFFAMPASIDGEQPMIGMKWVASFVANVANGGERATAMLIANDAVTGRPVAVVDGTLISAKRTAAAAAVALQLLEPPDANLSLALVGCGPIHYEIYRFIAHLFPITRLQLVDLDPPRLAGFAARLRAEFPEHVPPVAATLTEVLETADVVSIATNATTPHIESVPRRPFTILHVSLRDLAPSVIAGAVNIVDDIEHVCSARTSVHLATMETGHRDFIRATIPRLLSGDDHYERPAVPTIVSPFGMAILDLAVLREVLAHANGQSGITRVPGFRGGVWT